MTKHLQHEIERLKVLVVQLCSIVEDAVSEAVRAVEQRDLERALKIADSDDSIDKLEVELEEECLKVLALHQPVAIDLRIIIAILKINNDLERIGDLASNIAARARDLTKLNPVPAMLNFLPMATHVKHMLRQSIEALVKVDEKLASEVCRSDAQVDTLHREMFSKVQEAIMKDTKNTEHYITLLSVSRSLERIGDHATNIAEDILYMIEGEIHRHGHRQR